MKTLRYALFLGLGISLFIVGSLLVIAQDDHDDDHSEQDHELVERGHEVFTTNGCVACHGQNAEGNDIGPALAGHSEFAVRRQVRAPTNIMLAFSPAQIPADDLDALVAYILSLEIDPEGGHGHDEHDMGGITTGDLVFAHHWFLWLELEMGEVDGSIHHTAHILELLIDGPHKAMMQPVLIALGEGDLDTARAIVEPMVTDVDDFSHDIYTVGMQLTYQAVASGDQETARHFATDLSEHDLSEDQLATINSVLGLIEACELDNAMMSIDMALDGDVTFLPSDMEMDMSDDHSDDEAMDMSDDHSDDSAMDMSDDHSDDEAMDMGDDHSDDEAMDMGDDHNETSCGNHDEDMEATTEEHGD